MTPTINFHHIKTLEFGPISQFPAEEKGGQFSTRTLVLKDADGQAFYLGLFGDTIADLTLPGERPQINRPYIDECARCNTGLREGEGHADVGRLLCEDCVAQVQAAQWTTEEILAREG